MIETPSVTLSGVGAYLYDECKDEEVLLVGPAGSSKTIGAMKKLVDSCYAYPGSQHLLCRQTRKSMTDTTLPTLESIIGENHPEVLRTQRDQRHSYRLNGSEIVCAGLDQPSKAFGSAWGLVVLEEAIEADEGSWELFARAARDPRLRQKGQSSRFPYFQRIAITNPGSPDHWIHKRATECEDETLVMVRTYADYCRAYKYSTGPQDGKMRRLLAVHQDNPTLFDMDQWALLPEGERYMQALESMSGHRRAWMRWGLWRQPAGVVFLNWDESVHVVDEFEPAWPMVVAYDPGFQITGVVWLALSPEGGIYAIDEIYQGGLSVTQICLEIQRRNELYGRNVLRYFGDPNELMSSRAQGPSCAKQAAEAGLRFVPWPRDAGPAFDAGVDVVRTALDLAVAGKENTHYLKVCRRCKGLRSNFSSWSYKRGRGGMVVIGAEAYESANDHAIDPVRGTFQSGFLQSLHRRKLRGD